MYMCSDICNYVNNIIQNLGDYLKDTWNYKNDFLKTNEAKLKQD